MPIYTTREGYKTDWPGTPEQAARLGWTPAEPPVDKFRGMTKADLIALADEQGIDSTGTKADITARLTDQGSATADDPDPS